MKRLSCVLKSPQFSLEASRAASSSSYGYTTKGVRLLATKSTRRGSMFGRSAPPVVEHAPGSYAAVHAKFAQ